LFSTSKKQDNAPPTTTSKNEDAASEHLWNLNKDEELTSNKKNKSDR
jgi:hypothetical protein